MSWTTDEISSEPAETRRRSLKGTVEKPLSVGDLTDLVKLDLEREFSDVVVTGEISNCKPHSSGHWYFSLKDDRATISSVMFRYDAAKLKFKLQDGQKVLAVGRITVYPPRGNYQLVISRVEPAGVGALQLAFEQLKAKLQTEGLFSSERKRAIPQFPRTVGIVTSPTGAAIRDILNVLGRRFAGLKVLIYPVKVQGAGSGDEVSEAIRHFSQYFSDQVDVLIVGRGGGSIEDLWAFNEESVARALFECKIPVISAVGHEVDFTIADFVADVRAPTPSAAAELVVGSKVELLQHLDHMVKRLLQINRRVEMAQMQLDDLNQRLSWVVQEKVSELSLRFERLRSRLERSSPIAYFHRLSDRLDHLMIRFCRVPEHLFDKRRWELERLMSQLKLLNPRSIMERGYSIVRDAKTGRVIKMASEVKMGDKLIIELSKGKISARV